MNHIKLIIIVAIFILASAVEANDNLRSMQQLRRNDYQRQMQYQQEAEYARRKQQQQMQRELNRMNRKGVGDNRPYCS